MIDNKSIKKEIRIGLRNGTILVEDDARVIAKKYISDDEPSYEVTTAISDLLPKTPKTIIVNQSIKHPWFRGKMKTIVFYDTFGRMWSRSKGVIRKGIKTKWINGKYIIDTLGGMSWDSKKGRTFICEYRTSEESIQTRTNPQTFIG